MHPLNKGLVPIHYKYFVINLTLHHFLLSPVAWNIRVSLNLTSYTLSKLAGHATIMQYSRIFQNTREYSSASAASRMENWNQDLPERYSKFHGLYIKFQGHGKGRVIGPAPRSSKVAESMYKYLQTHIEVLKLVLLRVPINNNNYEQPIALFVIIPAKNTFTNQFGVI